MKLNKQGVRDLSSLRAKSPAKMFGDHELPPELAAKLLSNEQAQVSEFGAPLDPEVREFFEIMAEECAETIQRITKILRFGFRRNPWTGEDNRKRFYEEFGDIMATFEALTVLGILKFEPVYDRVKVKLAQFAVEVDPARPRLRHASDALRAKLAARARKHEFDLSDVEQDT